MFFMAKSFKLISSKMKVSRVTRAKLYNPQINSLGNFKNPKFSFVRLNSIEDLFQPNRHAL